MKRYRKLAVAATVLLAAALAYGLPHSASAAAGVSLRLQNLTTGTCIGRALTLVSCGADEAVFIVTTDLSKGTTLRNVRSALCLGVTRSVSPQLANVACNSSDTKQRWQQSLGSGGGALLESMAQGGICIGISGRNVQAQSCNLSLSQQWRNPV